MQGTTKLASRSDNFEMYKAKLGEANRQIVNLLK